MIWLWTFLGIDLLAMVWFRWRPLPPGVVPPPCTVRVRPEDVEFRSNLTWREDDRTLRELQLADTVVELIRGAREHFLCDVFLFNVQQRDGVEHLPTALRVCGELAARPDLPRFVLTDPANTLYGSTCCRPLEWLEAAGVTVCVTDTARLRDHNLLYAPIHRLFLQWLGAGRGGFLASPLREGRRITLRALLTVATGRANHRKVAVADDRVMVGSGNLEDASCYHDDVAVVVRSRDLARHQLRNEAAIARMSGTLLPLVEGASAAAEPAPLPAGAPPPGDRSGDPEEDEVLVTALTGRDIRRAILADLRSVRAGESVAVCMLYLSDRACVRELVASRRRGARVTVVLNGGSVERGEKPTNPNPAVAWELCRRAPGLRARLVRLRETQCHAKSILIERARRTVLHVGSANLTRRSLVGTNLEANLRIDLPRDAPAARAARRFHERMATDACSVPFPAGPPSRLPLWRYVLYRFQEHSGLATF